VLTIEDTAELQLQQVHVGRMESRPANVEGKGAVTQRDCLRNALRMRPDRIIVGETRGEEVIDMLQAMNTGHDGSMTTIHANNPRDAISRLENMVAMAGIEMPLKAVRSQIASAVNLIVQASRLQDGTRRMTSITEITGMEGEVISMQEVFRFERLGVEPESGKIIGRFNATGIRSAYSDRFRQWGLTCRPPSTNRLSDRLTCRSVPHPSSTS
jgi:pilus assembly protein CpaF